MVKDKCSSCLKGYDETKGNGYQPCGCKGYNPNPTSLPPKEK